MLFNIFIPILYFSTHFSAHQKYDLSMYNQLLCRSSSVKVLLKVSCLLK